MRKDREPVERGRVVMEGITKWSEDEKEGVILTPWRKMRIPSQRTCPTCRS